VSGLFLFALSAFFVSDFELRDSDSPGKVFGFGFAGLGKRALPYCALHVGSRFGPPRWRRPVCRVRVRGTRRGCRNAGPWRNSIGTAPIGRANKFSRARFRATSPQRIELELTTPGRVIAKRLHPFQNALDAGDPLAYFSKPPTGGFDLASVSNKLAARLFHESSAPAVCPI